MRLISRFLYRAPLLPLAALARPARAIFAEPLPRAALALAHPELVDNQAAEGARRRYAQRAAFRATPSGWWAGVGVGALGPRTAARTGALRPSLTVSWQRLAALGRALLDEAATRATVRLRVAPSLLVDGDTALWLQLGDSTEAIARRAEVDELLASVLAAAAAWTPWPALQPLADDDYLLALVDDGLLVHDRCPPLVGPPPLQWMRARVPALDAVAATLAGAADEDALAEARAMLARLPGANDGALNGVLVHEGPVTLSRAAVERAAELAPLLFALQEALTPPAAERAMDPAVADALEAVSETFGAGALELQPLALGSYGTPLDLDLDGDAPTPSAPLQALLVDRLVTAARAGAAEVALAADELAALAPPLQPPPSFELQLSPMRERRGAPPGDGWLLGLHAPAGATWGRFAHALGAPLAEALRDLVAVEAEAQAGALPLDVAYAPSAALADLTAHPPTRRATLALSSWPEAEAVTPAELALVADAAAPDPLALRATRPVVPSPLWRVRSTTAPRGVYRLLVGHALWRQHAPWALHLGALHQLAHVPRLRLDGFVVAPASWRIPLISSRATLRRWQRELDVPRYVQIGHEDELLLVDLDGKDALELLRRLPEEERPRAWEVWPPLDSCIDRGGRRLEAVVAVVVDDAARLAAHAATAAAGRVPPPSQRPAAAGWRTFKLFGAADRAERVLVGAVAPAIAEARAAGAIDAWFFLRYVDGPGRRDHLRLRVRGDAAAFAARLEEAIAPARAAGDVVTVEEAEYHREEARFGADAMAAVERVFEADSELACALLRSDDDGDVVEWLVRACDSLADGCGLDLAARQALARRRREAYGLGRDAAAELAAEYRRRQRRLRALLAAPSTPLAAHRAAVAAAIAELPLGRRRELLPPLLHLLAVRLGGADRTLELVAVYLWERTLESLTRHAER